MIKINGIGGIFFKAKDPSKIKAWYEKHLGIPADESGASFFWRGKDNAGHIGKTVWSVFPNNTKYFEPGGASFMINYRANNIYEIVNELQKSGIELVGNIEEYEYGRFAWILDPEGNKIELWEPIGEEGQN